MTEIQKVMQSIHPGSFTRVLYKSELPVKSEYRDFGFKVIKYTETTTRFGIRYDHMASYVPPIDNGEKKRKSNMKHIDRYMLENEKSGEQYVAMYPCKRGRNSYTGYVVMLNDEIYNFTDAEEIKEMVNDSYWNKGGVNNYQVVKSQNVLRVGNNILG